MTAIEFDNVGKMYRLGRVGTGTLSHDLNRWWTTTILRKEDPYLKIGEANDRSKKGSSDYVWALRDINLKVEQGDVLGIIGKNGKLHDGDRARLLIIAAQYTSLFLSVLFTQIAHIAAAKGQEVASSVSF